MEFLYAVALPFLFGLFLYALCKAVIAAKRRYQANRDRERYLRAVRPNEKDLEGMQNYFAMESLKAMAKPKKVKP